MTVVLQAAVQVHLAAGVLLTGALFLLLLAGPVSSPGARRWEAGVLSGARGLVALALASGLAVLMARAALFEGRPAAALEAGSLARTALLTWPGQVWLARHGLLALLGVFLLLRAEVSARRDWLAARWQALGLAALSLGLLAGSGHAAAITPPAAWPVAVEAVHLLGAGIWAGGLAPLALLLGSARRDAQAAASGHAARAVRRFSGTALLTMLVLLASGVAGAIVHVESVAGLLGTVHGRLLLAKLALLVPVLALAALNRTWVLAGAPAAGPGLGRLATFVGLEAGLALLMAGLGAAMTVTTPGRHEDPAWPLPFRLVLPAGLAGPAPGGPTLLGGLLVLAGLGALGVGWRRRPWRAPVLMATLAAVAIGAGVAGAPRVVTAYPTSYRRPLVAYRADSVAAGAATFARVCATCHGAGRWPGPSGAAPTGLDPPAASTRLAGELFWLSSHGTGGRMPGFAGHLEEAGRWDLVNFLRAQEAAGASTGLGPRVEIDRPWLVAPDFAIPVGPLTPGALRDYRGRRMVLLVLYRWPGSRARMAALARGYSALSTIGVEVVAVPSEASPRILAELGETPPVMFPVVTDGNAAVVATYRLFAPGPGHAELLIDRQGYIRAIWREAPGDPDETGAVQREAERLNEERSPPPFPDDHVH